MTGLQKGTPLAAIRQQIDARFASRKDFSTPTPQPP
jgi:hypothetical protein